MTWSGLNDNYIFNIPLLEFLKFESLGLYMMIAGINSSIFLVLTFVYCGHAFKHAMFMYMIQAVISN